MTYYDNISDEQVDEMCRAFHAEQGYYQYDMLPLSTKALQRSYMRAALKKLLPIVPDEGMVERVVAFLNRTKFDRSGPLIGCKIRAILTAALTVPEEPEIEVGFAQVEAASDFYADWAARFQSKAPPEFRSDNFFRGLYRAMERARTQRQQGEK